MTRKFFVGGNWKMNGTKSSIDEICSWLVSGPLDPNCEVVVGVPGCYLQHVADKLAGSSVAVAAPYEADPRIGKAINPSPAESRVDPYYNVSHLILIQ